MRDYFEIKIYRHDINCLITIEVMCFQSFGMRFSYTVVVATVHFNLFFCNKKIKFIHFRKRSVSFRDIFLEKNFLSVIEIHVHELLKLVLHAVTKFLFRNFFSDLLLFENEIRSTRHETVENKTVSRTH